MALSSKGNATKRLVTTAPVFAKAALRHHVLWMQVTMPHVYTHVMAHAAQCLTNLQQLSGGTVFKMAMCSRCMCQLWSLRGAFVLQEGEKIAQILCVG